VSQVEQAAVRDRDLRLDRAGRRAEALYLEAVADELSGEGVDRAIATYSERSLACGAGAWEAADVLPPAAFRLYRAKASARFVLGPGDQRLPIQNDNSEEEA
jgi:hypothetical protein